MAAGGPGRTFGGHSLALTEDGKLYAWGDNGFGQLGSGAPGGVSPVPVAVSGLDAKPVTAIGAGAQHSLALAGGNLYAWGNNASGQLGYDTPSGLSSAPTQVSGLDGPTQVAGGYAHTLARSADGRVWAWGATGGDYYGQTGATASPTPVEVTGFEGPVASIAAGGYHSLTAVGARTTAGLPSNRRRPGFTGQAKEGQTLNGDRGLWSGGGLSFRYQWKRCDANGSSCQDIAGATSLDYTLQAADVGDRVKLVVTATNTSGSASAESELSDEVAAAGGTPPACQASSRSRSSSVMTDCASPHGSGESTRRWHCRGGAERCAGRPLGAATIGVLARGAVFGRDGLRPRSRSGRALRWAVPLCPFPFLSALGRDMGVGRHHRDVGQCDAAAGGLGAVTRADIQESLAQLDELSPDLRYP